MRACWLILYIWDDHDGTIPDWTVDHQEFYIHCLRHNTPAHFPLTYTGFLALNVETHIILPVRPLDRVLLWGSVIRCQGRGDSNTCIGQCWPVILETADTRQHLKWLRSTFHLQALCPSVLVGMGLFSSLDWLEGVMQDDIHLPQMHPRNTFPHCQGPCAFSMWHALHNVSLPRVPTCTVRAFFPWPHANLTWTLFVLLQQTFYVTLFTEETFPLPHQPLPHHCTHQLICILSLREDLPFWVWDKSSALTLPWLIRTPQVTFLQWGSLFSSHSC